MLAAELDKCKGIIQLASAKVKFLEAEIAKRLLNAGNTQEQEPKDCASLVRLACRIRVKILGERGRTSG